MKTFDKEELWSESISKIYLITLYWKRIEKKLITKEDCGNQVTESRKTSE